ncbi:uncharacterized protein Z519_12745 [Cladophialophora bantiana CBS 173.52]|uniref:CYTH domain-containing protein n=1 Tax=Cladophialophora bantiana (strain ATCC 10958 / CBS 173.52 / CDC B-1940 / NIH 8579) TaxID=1442370 RepID=A0A0D2H6X0_CLAB1|nr:uncharacterized protein Z519_12745 [Cladophialophora bantiana CBS 173.52]KIW86620.1 hypothetical protein Z519_12745 [Cladophialophora bantiana CBS 173.52]
MTSSLVPDYEVKVLLKPTEVLASSNRLKDAVQSEFDIMPGTKKMNIQFVDTEKKAIYTSGWNLRIRKTEGKKYFELTYKKRYPVKEGYYCTAEGNINTALETALQEGFNSATTYGAQVEVGYQEQTLSISYDAKLPDEGFEGMDLPDPKDSRKFLTEKAPKEFKNWSSEDWGTQHLANSIVYGPVHAKRFEGIWDGFKLFIEVWPIRKSKTDESLELIVEASFKTPDLKKALEGRARLIKSLQKRAWILDKDSLKTKLIMERYGTSNE